MALRKFGAPATAHVRHITAEDVEVLNTELPKIEDKDEEDNAEVSTKKSKKGDD